MKQYLKYIGLYVMYFFLIVILLYGFLFGGSFAGEMVVQTIFTQMGEYLIILFILSAIRKIKMFQFENLLIAAIILAIFYTVTSLQTEINMYNYSSKIYTSVTAKELTFGHYFIYFTSIFKVYLSLFTNFLIFVLIKQFHNNEKDFSIKP